MSLPQRKRLPHQVPQWVRDGSLFFISINCQTRFKNQLCRSPVGEAILAAAAYYHEHLKWYCRLMLLMPDHLHGIIAFPADVSIQEVVTNWKRFLARTQDVEWQRDFFDHRLRDHHEEMKKISYILLNPVRRRLCNREDIWPWVFRGDDRLPPNVMG